VNFEMAMAIRKFNSAYTKAMSRNVGSESAALRMARMTTVFVPRTFTASTRSCIVGPFTAR